MSQTNERWRLPSGHTLTLTRSSPVECVVLLEAAAPVRDWRDRLASLVGGGRSDDAFVRAAFHVYDHVRDPFEIARHALPRLEASLASSASPGKVAKQIFDGLRAEGLKVFEMPNEDVHAAAILDGLVELKIEGAIRDIGLPKESALGWYLWYYGVRADAFDRQSRALFSVGEAVWDDDWVFHVACALKKNGVDPLGSLVVLVCADPLQYSTVLTEKMTLASLGALSGDILHFVWMVDRHGKPSLATKLEILAQLRSRNIEVADDALLLLLVSLSKVGKNIVADVHSTIPILGRLDDAEAREVFKTMIERTREGRAKGHDVTTIADDIRGRVARARALQQTVGMLEWLKKVVAAIFKPGSDAS